MKIVTGFLKKNLIGIIAIVLLLGCGGVVYGGINSQEADRGEDPLVYENPDHKEVFPEGTGYSLNKLKAGEYQLPEKEKKQEDVVTGSASENLSDSSSSGLSFGGSSSGGGYVPSKVSTNPTFTTDLKKTQKVTSGKEFSFYVEPKLYGNSNPKASEYDLTVTYNGKTLKGKSSGSLSFSYSAKAVAGDKSVTITLTDKKLKKTTKASYKIVGVENAYVVKYECTFENFNGVDEISSSMDVSKSKSITVEDVLNEMLGKGNYDTLDDKVFSVTMSDDEIYLSDDRIDEIMYDIEDAYDAAGVELSDDAWDSYRTELESFNIAEDGIVSNNDELIPITLTDLDTTLTYSGTWTLYKGRKEVSLSDEISGASTIKLAYEISLVK